MPFDPVSAVIAACGYYVIQRASDGTQELWDKRVGRPIARGMRDIRKLCDLIVQRWKHGGDYGHGPSTEIDDAYYAKPKFLSKGWDHE